MSIRKRIRGAGLTEYGLLAGLIAVVAISSVSALGNKVETVFDTTNDALSSAIQQDTLASDGGSEGAGAENPFDQPTDTLDLVYDLSSGAGSIAINVSASSSGSGSYDIDWGDGTIVSYSGNGIRSHSYGSAGVYTVSISGTVYRLINSAPLDKLVEVSSWGDVGLVYAQLSDADNLVSVVQPAASIISVSFYHVDDVPDEVGAWDVSGLSYASSMFNGAGGIPDLTGWDTSGFTDMYSMFAASTFNQDISGWDVSAVENFGYMFDFNSSMSYDLSGWTTTSATYMNGMFRNASAFNADLSGWSVGGVTSCGNFARNAGIGASNMPNFTSCTP